MKLIVIYIAGLIFGLGISISGMANPAKVLNFFDVAGTWDPSLLLVMVGAVVMTFIGYKIVLRRSTPFLSAVFQLPNRRDIDGFLIGGSALFGIGWGIAGFCPGGALPVIGTGNIDVLLFVGSVIAGVFIARLLRPLLVPRLFNTN